MTLGTTKRFNAGPLAGLKVVEVGHYVAAPFCARLLGDLGAEVFKIEPIGGDPVRSWGKKKDGRSIWWSIHGRNKRSVSLNLKLEAGRSIVKELISRSDVLIENFRPGQLAALGMPDEELRAANPKIVIAHISGYGQDGPDRDRAGFGAIGEAIGGLRHLTNHPPGESSLPPVRVGVSVGDSIAGLYAAFGILAALWQRDRQDGSSLGQRVDVALTEAVLSLMEGLVAEYGALGEIRGPIGSRIPTAAPSNAYPTSDSRWIIIAANSEPLFAKLANVIGKADLPFDTRFADNPSRVENAEVLDRIISSWTQSRSALEVELALAAADIPACRIFDASDIATNRQFLERGMVREIDDPLLGRVLHPGIVPHMPDMEGAIRSTGPEIGADTELVLTRELGYSAAEVITMREQGVIR